MPSAARIAAAPVIAALRLRFLMVSPRWVVAGCDLVTSQCWVSTVRVLRNPEGVLSAGQWREIGGDRGQLVGVEELSEWWFARSLGQPLSPSCAWRCASVP
jgi:hypothetical protein